MAPTDVCSPVTDAAHDGDSVECLRRQVAELTEAVAARDAFIAVAGHDLRNAMTPVVGQVDLLMCSIAAGNRTGFGIELWIVGQFVAAMEGTVAIDDAPGGEALITVTLPLHLRTHAH